MKWLLRRSLVPSDIPPTCVRSALAGAVFGPVVGVFLHWVLGRPWDYILSAPGAWIGRTMAAGLLYSLSFYVISGMPWVFLRAPVIALSPSLRTLTGISISACSGALFALVSVGITRLLWGVQLVPEEWLTRLLAIEAFAVVILGMFMGAFHDMRMQAELRERKLAEAAARAQVYALQAQIAPHFFFNALNSISSLVTSDPVAAQQMIGRLAEIFRYTFTSGRAPMVTLEKEVAFVREYLLLEKFRYRDRLRFTLDEAGEASAQRLPALTLQPIVENAIRHGIARRMDGGEIRMEIKAAAAHIRIEVWNQFDPGDGPPDLRAETIFRENHALANIRQRLQLSYGEEAALEIAQARVDWTLAALTLPRREEGADAHSGG
ncbi:histidine kinase [uncultured Paludibaculum sp.]|uniref:sensor histidine kinase n=1 Tax=uncultured Paludibaculum sp. TaxID=1765020 RepID=UPI002AAA66CC|nr:histidine kinase [uncultured Paludibaculum sp.]